MALVIRVCHVDELLALEMINLAYSNGDPLPKATESSYGNVVLQ